MESAHANKLGLAQYDFYKLYNEVNPATMEKLAHGPGLRAGGRPLARHRVPGHHRRQQRWLCRETGYDYCTGIGSVQAATLSGQL